MSSELQMAVQKFVGRRVTFDASAGRLMEGIVCRAYLAREAQECDGVAYSAGDVLRCRVATTAGVYRVWAIEKIERRAGGALHITGRVRPVVTEVSR